MPGEKGDKGDTGAIGPQGEKGDTGATVPQGEKGDTGAIGLQGVPGVPGEKGDKGDTGAIGLQGEKGDTGDVGPKGDRGNTGAVGPKGDKGNTGDVGPKGDKGNTGATRPKGDTGPADLSRIVHGDNKTRTKHITNFNAILPSGFYDSYNAAGTPVATWSHLISSRHYNEANNYQMQIAGSFFSPGDLFYRIISNNVPSAWNRLWHEGNFKPNRHLQKRFRYYARVSAIVILISLNNILNKAGMKLLVENFKIVKVLKPLQGK